MKNAIAILSYNMPHLTDALFNQLNKLVKIEAHFYIFDNGSDPGKAAYCTTHRESQNTRLTGGMNHLLKLTKDYDYVWLCTNDIQINTSGDPLASMIEKCEADKTIGCIHPSLVLPVPNYAYQYMVKEPNQPNRTGVTKGHPMVDIICPLYTKAALDANNWEFDSRFTYGWGIDYDSCLKLRQAGLQVAVDFDVLVSHQTSVTYDSGGDKEFSNRQAYYSKAMENMNNVMTEKYGINWRALWK